MKIQKLYPTNFSHNNPRQGINTVKWTGYAAVIAGVGSGIAANRKQIKLHKNLAYIAGIFTLAHIGIVEYKKFQYKNLQKQL